LAQFAEQERQKAELARQSAEQERQRALAQSQRNKSLCHMAAVCAKYATTRQECATAGNFDTCINVKMGDDTANISACTNDGELYEGEPTDMPNPITCFLIEKLGVNP
jgi:hypothetical protein